MRYSDSFPKRLSLRLVRATVILFSLSILVVGFFSYRTIYQNAVKETSLILEKNLLEIQNVLSDVESVSKTASWILTKRGISEEELLEYTYQTICVDTNIVSCAVGFERNSFANGREYYCPIAFLNNDGKVESIVMGSEDYDYFSMDWYSIPKRLGQPYWSDPAPDSDVLGRKVVSYSRPLFDAKGELLAVVRYDMDYEWLSRKIQEIRPYKNSHAVLVGENEEFKNSEVNSFTVYAPLDNGWSGALICTKKDVLAQAHKMNLISILVVLVALSLLFYSNKKIVEDESRPITAIAYSALSIAQGNFKARIPDVASKDELRRLHDSLHYLEESIDKYIYELRNTTSSKERYESELNIASAIQMQMLPKDYPHTDEVDLYATLHPAKEVGGDLYDFFVKDRMLYFAVGDVSGKGVPASLYMAITRSAFRFIAGLGLPVDGIVTKINNAFCDGNDSGMFVTMFVGRIDLDTLMLEYCNAGHNPIIVVEPDGKPKYHHAQCNLAAGLVENFPYSGEYIQLKKGSKLLIYTDGVTEAEDLDKELYGEDRLEEFIRNEEMSKSSSEIADDLTKDIKNFTNGNPQNDDITIMMIKL